MPIEIRILRAGDERVLAAVADGVFDRPIDPQWTAAFLAAPNHHLAVALDGNRVIGMATAVHYFHPDKPPELWINEVGVSASHRVRGLGRRLVATLFAAGKAVGCSEAWTLTHEGNTAARRLFASLGGRELEAGSLMIGFELARVP